MHNAVNEDDQACVLTPSKGTRSYDRAWSLSSINCKCMVHAAASKADSNPGVIMDEIRSYKTNALVSIFADYNGTRTPMAHAMVSGFSPLLYHTPCDHPRLLCFA
jgi:hypothetical protein